MTDLLALSDNDLAKLDRDLRFERLRRRGAWKQCGRCHTTFLGRGDARFCSARCRVSDHRSRDQQAQ